VRLEAKDFFMNISKQQLNEVSTLIVDMMQLDMPVDSARKAADLAVRAQDILIAVWDASDPQPLPKTENPTERSEQQNLPRAPRSHGGR